MRDEHLVDEDLYLAVREEQLMRRLERAGFSRRRILKRSPRAVLLAGAARAAISPPRGVRGPRPIVKPLPPEWFVDHGSSAEMRWDAVAGLGYFIPNERFFVRDHSSTPLIDARTWTLSLWGDGLRAAPTRANPFRFGYDELCSLPAVEIPAFIECAGNGRSLFAGQQGTPASGTQWGLGAVGVARWRGVPLAEVLERAGIVREAVDVMPWGLDAPYVTGGVDYGPVRRPLPVAKAGEAILAYEMNGRPLPPDHGYPVRLVVPGWVGVASVKWVGQIQVSRVPLYSYWNTTSYSLQGSAYPSPVPLTGAAVKSAFELAWGAALPNRPQILAGRSWSGLAPIKRVVVSTDGGASWRPARLRPPNLPDAWVRWECSWSPRRPGNYILQARATDHDGRTQPATVPLNAHGYLFGAVVKHPVTVWGTFAPR
ncbi:MAG TPA: sulfite oxidase [Solirubrobacteraceae bacterium]|nr:sulfite oxidase [Solirubrobacteraceae bacterium]